MSELTEIDHVAIAVADLDAAIEYYEQTFGCTVAHREVVESDGVEEALLKVADSYVQLLTPTRDDSPVAKYIAKNGEGLHHVGYRVSDCGRDARPGEGRGPPGDRRAATARKPGHDGRIHPSQDGVRHPDRAGAGIGRSPAGPANASSFLV